MSKDQKLVTKIQHCLSAEDDKVAFACIKDVIRIPKEESVCQPKIVLLTQGGCGPCSEERERFAHDIETGLVQLVDIDSPYGRTIAERNQVDSIPAIMILDCEDNIIETEGSV